MYNLLQPQGVLTYQHVRWTFTSPSLESLHPRTSGRPSPKFQVLMVCLKVQLHRHLIPLWKQRTHQWWLWKRSIIILYEMCPAEKFADDVFSRLNEGEKASFNHGAKRKRTELDVYEIEDESDNGGTDGFRASPSQAQVLFGNKLRRCRGGVDDYNHDDDCASNLWELCGRKCAPWRRR